MNWNNIRELTGSNPNVKKFVFENKDAVAEAVLYKYPTYETRTVICCSTQSGCPVGCRFCGAGDYFVRSLSGDQIVSQVDHLLQTTNVSVPSIERLQVMFMSMGEPLLNINGLGEAIHKLYEKYPNARLLISSIAPKIDFSKVLEISNVPTVGLQFSIHESTDEKRNKLIPFKNKNSLAEIAVLGKQWAEHTQRRPFFNYCANEHNSTQEDAERLFKLFDPNIWECTISVVCEREEHVAAANERQRNLADSFQQKMIQLGYSTRMFDPAGQDDIGGGCGQLFHVQKWFKSHPELAKKSVGHYLPVVHMPVPE